LTITIWCLINLSTTSTIITTTFRTRMWTIIRKRVIIWTMDRKMMIWKVHWKKAISRWLLTKIANRWWSIKIRVFIMLIKVNIFRYGIQLILWNLQYNRFLNLIEWGYYKERIKYWDNCWLKVKGIFRNWKTRIRVYLINLVGWNLTNLRTKNKGRWQISRPIWIK